MPEQHVRLSGLLEVCLGFQQVGLGTSVEAMPSAPWLPLGEGVKGAQELGQRAPLPTNANLMGMPDCT